MSARESFYRSAPVERRVVDDATLAVRRFAARRIEGMLRYLAGPTWDEVDALRTRHAELIPFLGGTA